VNSFPIWAGWPGQNSSKKLKPPRLILRRQNCIQYSVPETIGSKASTFLTNATSQESRRDPNGLTLEPRRI
jgi:hypothetical protein